MKITEKGLVLKEVKLREADKILTLLTEHHGILSVSARGSMRPNSRLFAACGLYGYSEWTLHEGKKIYSVDEAASIEVFFGLRESIEGISLAAYMAELLQLFSPVGAEARQLLRLALNSLYLLSGQKREAAFVKAVFEMRSLSEIGFMPDVLACAGCGRYQGDAFFLDVGQALLLCAHCAAAKNLAPNLNAAALAALRHIVLSEDDKVFSFSLAGESLAMLRRLCEAYVLFHLEVLPKTLHFLNSVLNP